MPVSKEEFDSVFRPILPDELEKRLWPGVLRNFEEWVGGEIGEKALKAFIWAMCMDDDLFQSVQKLVRLEKRGMEMVRQAIEQEDEGQEG
jgi:hypothetical protein